MPDEILAGVKSVAVAGHVRPDGDCVGACLGLYSYIKDNYPGIAADVYLDKIPECFKDIVPYADVIRHEAKTGARYDVFFALDAADKKRLGFSEPIFDEAVKTVCIDHHISNGGYADINEIRADVSSTSELLYQLMDGEKISENTAICLYLGIIHDTGVFQYSCATPRTLEIAADLMRRGVPANMLIERTFTEKTYAQNQITGRALLESFLFMDGKCIVSYITKKVMDLHMINESDLDGIVSMLRATKGVEVAIFMYECGESEYKVSLRSTDKVDVSLVAAAFGGGGHKKAAGVTMRGTAHRIINSLSEMISKQI